MKLDVANWKPFQIDKMFDIYTGGDLIMGEITEGDIPIASNSAENNNIAAYTSIISDRKLFDHTKSISIADRGKFWAFIQAKDFYIATRVKALVCKDCNILNIYQLSFIVSVLNQESFKFAYGRNCCANLPLIKISLPVQYNLDGSPVIDSTFRYSDEGYVPDWQWMESYVKTLHHLPLTTKNTKSEKRINIEEWKDFEFGKLISKIYKAKAHNKDDLTETNSTISSIRYITRTGEDNGCELIVSMNDIDRDTIEEANAITIGDTTATCFYQDEKFIAGDHMVVVRAEWLNKARALFILSILRKEQYKYSYGRAFLMDRIKSTTLKLPILHNDDGTPYVDTTYQFSNNGYVPDWIFMENYIKSLPYGDRI